MRTCTKCDRPEGEEVAIAPNRTRCRKCSAEAERERYRTTAHVVRTGGVRMRACERKTMKPLFSPFRAVKSTPQGSTFTEAS